MAIKIISGKYRGRNVDVLISKDLRPTPARVRETLFNWLNPYITNANCLDLFAGTGILGLEALSRGANKVCFIDRSKKAITNIKNICQNYAVRNQVNFICTEIPKKNIDFKQNFDIIFIDPPFKDLQIYLSVLEWLLKCCPLNNNVILYIETNQEHIKLPTGIQCLKRKKAGHVYYGIYKII